MFEPILGATRERDQYSGAGRITLASNAIGAKVVKGGLLIPLLDLELGAEPPIA